MISNLSLFPSLPSLTAMTNTSRTLFSRSDLESFLDIKSCICYMKIV
ncbi:hypothetical protein AtNW77_Chr2g0267561 [Arabidopsis thaliana]